IAAKEDGAVEYMMQKYGGLVKKEVRTVYLIGAETEDLAQEGMIGLFKAVRDYESDKGASFLTFATMCVRNQIKTAITASNRKKHIPLNSYISIYAEDTEDGFPLMELEADRSDYNPEELVLAREQNSDLKNRIDSELSTYEKKVIDLYLDGLSYLDIADRLGKTEKSIDNALTRIRSKLSK
ncbi:MAG: sigma-70 family RNA polymerase sigma factor, partial [Lachnospiraceae bacterium]|nr:sigma-70 family RNA polymerase sigma factor [Lachnospiraceae bacterium]